MLEFRSYASSSKGNLNTLTDGETTIVLDCGVDFGKTRKLLNHNITGVDAVLCSHQHADHSKAMPGFAKSGIDCYALPETLAKIKLSGHRYRPIKYKEVFNVGTFRILAFPLTHCELSGKDIVDVPCCGFLISTGKEKAVYITDTSHCRFVFNGLTLISIECNHDTGILNENVNNGLVPKIQKTRLMMSHLSLAVVGDFIRSNDMSKVKAIWLLHLSDGNSDAAMFEREIKALTGVPVFVAPELCDELRAEHHQREAKARYPKRG